MAEVVNEIQNNIKTPFNGNASGNSATQKVSCDHWYIFRYKTLTKAIRGYFQKHSDVVYFPLRKERRVRELSPESQKRKVGRKPIFDAPAVKIEFIEQPCIPGYIFVNAPIEDAISLGKEVGLNPWKRKYIQKMENSERKITKECLYYSIPNDTMVKFMDVVSHFQEGIRIYDPSEIDPEENDLVEIISGNLAGRRGYIKTHERKDGGIVIVPLLYDEDCEGDTLPEEKDIDNTQRNAFIHVGIEVEPNQFRIIRFANPVRKNDIIKRTNQKVKELLKDFADGKVINEVQQKRLRGYATRYESAEMTTDIQRANLTLLLYRIYTIIEDTKMLTKLNLQIKDTILPAFDKHIENETGKRKTKVAAKKTRFNEEKEEIDNAFKQRKIRIFAQQSEYEPGQE